MSQIIIRELQKNDLWNGFLTVLDLLSESSNMRKEDAEKIFDGIMTNENHIIMVAEEAGRIIGSATLLIESKFIHNGGRVGHIEDVVVDKIHHRKGIGKKMVLHLLEISKNNGCYKTILDCTDNFKPFYEKIGFKHHANALRFDHV